MCTIYPHRCFPIYIHCLFCAILPLNQSLMAHYIYQDAYHAWPHIYIQHDTSRFDGECADFYWFQRATDSFKTYAKGYDMFLTPKLPFCFGGISLNHLPRNTSTRQGVKRPDAVPLYQRQTNSKTPINPFPLFQTTWWIPTSQGHAPVIERKLKSSLDFHFAVWVAVGRSRNSLKFYGLLNAVIRNRERQDRIWGKENNQAYDNLWYSDFNSFERFCIP